MFIKKIKKTPLFIGVSILFFILGLILPTFEKYIWLQFLIILPCYYYALKKLCPKSPSFNYILAVMPFIFGMLYCPLLFGYLAVNPAPHNPFMLVSGAALILASGVYFDRE